MAVTHKKRLLGVAAVATASVLLISAAPASAKPPKVPTPSVKLSSPLQAPFNLAMHSGKVYFADGGLNQVGRLKGNGKYSIIAKNKPGASGVDLSRNGRYLAFTTTVTNFSTFENTASGLHIWKKHGRHIYANTLAYEKKHNPDKVNVYGTTSTDKCVTDALGPAGPGGIDSHAYSVAAYKGGWIVADAGANALLKVSNKGKIKKLAVLPPQPAKITEAARVALNHQLPPGAPELPTCIVGTTYRFEPVPTDVEVGKNGKLYVTVLPGGPEGPELGARGKVYRVGPKSGKVSQVASGFLGATNLAIGKHNKIYVAELFGGQISTVSKGHAKPYLTLPGVVAVETTKGGTLWAGTLGDPEGKPPVPGTIVKITKKRASAKAMASTEAIIK